MPDQWTLNELESDEESNNINVMVENMRKEIVHPSMCTFYVMMWVVYNIHYIYNILSLYTHISIQLTYSDGYRSKLENMAQLVIHGKETNQHL